VAKGWPAPGGAATVDTLNLSALRSKIENAVMQRKRLIAAPHALAEGRCPNNGTVARSNVNAHVRILREKRNNIEFAYTVARHARRWKHTLNTSQAKAKPHLHRITKVGVENRPIFSLQIAQGVDALRVAELFIQQWLCRGSAYD